jgi:hypothetical protein
VINHQILTADERLLLLSLFLRYGELSAFTCSIQQLVKDHPASKKSITAFFKKMQSIGFLSVEKRPSPRYPNSYVFTTECSSYIKKDHILVCVTGENAWRYLKVICGSYEPIVRRNEDIKLSNSNRFFLLILILNSDSLGAVRRLSVSELSQMMGVSNGSIKLRIKALKAIGLLSVYIPGWSHKAIFGKSKGVLILDVMNNFISDLFPKATRLTANMSNFYDSELFGFSEVSALFAGMKTIHLTFNEYDFDLNSIRKLFDKDNRRAKVSIHDHLQFVICHFTSIYLIEHWNLIGTSNEVQPIDESLTLDFLTPKNVIVNDVYVDLLKLISLWIHRTAIAHKFLLLFQYGVSFRPKSMLIIPTKKLNTHFSKFEVVFEAHGKYQSDVLSVGVDGEICSTIGNAKEIKFNEFVGGLYSYLVTI